MVTQGDENYTDWRSVGIPNVNIPRKYTFTICDTKEQALKYSRYYSSIGYHVKTLEYQDFLEWTDEQAKERERQVKIQRTKMPEIPEQTKPVRMKGDWPK